MDTTQLRRGRELITNFWSTLTVVAKQHGYHGAPFKSERGTTQGDIISPTIFNIVIDAVVRAWSRKMDSEGLSHTVQANFYADDGHLYSNGNGSHFNIFLFNKKRLYPKKK
jgi:hypothetical protein